MTLSDVQSLPTASAAPATDELLVEITRGPMVESRHRAVLAVSDAAGRILLHSGDLEQQVYPRSAIKPLQALALIESGAADAFGLGSAEIALACASHSGEPRHVATVAAWLERIGCSHEDLECGGHLPYDEDAAHRMIAEGTRPSGLHNNCSGKHAGFLSIARHLGYPTAGYIRYEHPVQQRVLGVLEGMTGLDLSAAPRGIDGCGIPTLGVPLGNLALAMARLADPSDQPDARQTAAARIRQAMTEEPFMIAGSKRYCTAVIEETKGRALVKTGAEGVYCGALPEQGLGFALKVEDGATRAGELLAGRLLRRLGVLEDAAEAAIAARHPSTLVNRMGREVGEIRLAAGGLLG